MLRSLRFGTSRLLAGVHQRLKSRLLSDPPGRKILVAGEMTPSGHWPGQNSAVQHPQRAVIVQVRAEGALSMLTGLPAAAGA